MKKIVFFIAFFIGSLLFSGCGSADYRLLKNFLPSTMDIPENVEVSVTFPATLEAGAVPDVLSMKVRIKNNGDKTIYIDPSKIYLSIGANFYSPIPISSLRGRNNKVNLNSLKIKKGSVAKNRAVTGMLYFPKSVAEKIKRAGVFNLNIDLGMGRKAVIVIKK